MIRCSSSCRSGGMISVIDRPIASSAGVLEQPLRAGVPRRDDAFEGLADDRVVGGFDDRREQRARLRCFLYLVEVGADLVLPLPCAQRGSDPADQRGDPDRTFEQRHVSEIFQCSQRRRRVGPLMRQDQQREVGPRRLVFQKLDQLAAPVIGNRFLGQQHGTGARIERTAQRNHVGADRRFDSGLAQNRLDQLGISAGRSEDPNPRFERVGIAWLT